MYSRCVSIEIITKDNCFLVRWKILYFMGDELQIRQNEKIYPLSDFIDVSHKILMCHANIVRCVWAKDNYQ